MDLTSKKIINIFSILIYKTLFEKDCHRSKILTLKIIKLVEELKLLE